MKSNTFNYSLLAVGVAALMSVSTGAMAAKPTGGTGTGSFDVTNKAEATYKVAGNETEQKAASNEVKITVNETSSFSLVADNVNIPINPQANSVATFTHTLKNEGNVNDSYILDLKNVNGDDFNYSGYVVTYTKTSNGTPQTISLDTNGRATSPITLTPNEIATITILATANTARSIDKNGILTVSAESAYLKAKNTGTPAAYTASNTDNAKTTTPVYAITKSATTNLGNKNLDLNNANAYVDYTITVTNQGNINGTAVTIEDALPNGLTLVPSTQADIYTAPVIKRNNAVITVTPEVSTNKITFKNVDIAKNDVITITFRAKKSSAATSTSDFSNYATVKDNTKSDVNANTPDLIDHSNDKTNDGVAEVNYENPVGTGSYPGKDDNTDATVTTTNQTRSIAISQGINKEVPLLTPNTENKVGNTYIYTITNNGTDIIEAATVNSVKFSVKPTASTINGVDGTTDNNDISIARVFADINNDGVFNSGDIELTGTQVGTTSEYTYDLNQAKTTGFAAGTANAIKIGVQVSASGTGSNLAGEKNNIDDSETLTLAVLPQGPVNGTPKPVDVSTTSKTTMKGINLQKYQIVANCDATLPAANNAAWSITTTTATSGQCIFYKLEAENTFTESNRAISNLAISDTLVSSVTYQGDFTPSKTVTTPTQIAPPLIKGTFGTLDPQETVNIRFSVKPSQSGTN
ncbi:hypothetical protein ACTXLD_08635 [Psychrobacter faecalis]